MNGGHWWRASNVADRIIPRANLCLRTGASRLWMIPTRDNSPTCFSEVKPSGSIRDMQAIVETTEPLPVVMENSEELHHLPTAMANSMDLSLPPSMDEDEIERVVGEMLLIVAAQDETEVTKTMPPVTRDDIRKIYRDVNGDPGRVFDDVMTLLAVRALRFEEETARTSQDRVEEAKLQWHELCVGLGLNECHAFVRMLDDMPESERDAALSEHGGFFQQLLLQSEEVERENQLYDDLLHALLVGKQVELEAKQRQQEDEAHPLEQLQSMFPDYKLNVIEDVFEAHHFNLDATASALMNIGAVSHVKSFASIVKAQRPTTAWVAPQTDEDEALRLYEQRPAVESLGHFPVLPVGSKQRHKRQRKKTEYKTLDEFTRTAGPMILRHSNGAAPRAREVVKQHKPVVNAWNTQATPTDAAPGTGPMESKLTTELKLSRLYRLLPSIDRELIRSTFFLNDASSTATEAALREIFQLPVPEPPPQPIMDDEDKSPVTTADAHLEANPTYAECRAHVNSCWGQLSDRYIAALQSFNRNHHVIVGDRVREIAAGRRALREAQHAAAHAFVMAHMPNIRRQQALDLHYLTVLEANRVMKEVIEICRAERIRRCILICGVGNHSINQKARLLTSIQLSLEHRRIAFRKESGALFIYPLRSTN